MKRRLLKTALFLAVFIFVINALANLFYWYDAIYGFDKIVHTYGGLFLAILFGAMFASRAQAWSTKRFFWILLIAVFTIGLVWEFYEYIVQFFIKNIHIANVIDSIGDLAFDLVGGIIGTIFVLRDKRRYNSTHDGRQSA